MTIFDNGLSMLSESLQKVTEINVVYHQGTRFFTVPATRGNISYGTISKFGDIQTNVDYREYVVRVDVLPTGFAPKVRDVIVDANSRWEAFNNSGQDCWRYCDSNKTLIRIFTRRVA